MVLALWLARCPRHLAKLRAQSSPGALLSTVCSSCGRWKLPVLGVPSIWPSIQHLAQYCSSPETQNNRHFHHWTRASTISPDWGFTRPSSNCQELFLSFLQRPVPTCALPLRLQSLHSSHRLWRTSTSGFKKVL